MGPRLPSVATAGRRRRQAWAGTALAVLALHAVVLLAAAPPHRRPGEAAAQARAAVAVRVLPQPAAAPAQAAATPVGSVPAVRHSATASPGAATRDGAEGAGVARAAGAAGVARVAGVTGSTRVDRSTAPPAAARAAGAAPALQVEPAAADAAGRPAPALAAAPPPGADGAPVPVYPTRLPPSSRLLFEVQRSAALGRAELVWLHGADGYELTLQGELLGRPILEAASRGGIDADGLAPVRHVERRRSRDVRAVNFQRDAGIVTFSGPPVEYPLWRGAQDRLSWLVQLPAIVAADPHALGVPGARVTVRVVGARGDAEAWGFVATAREAVARPDGSTAEALHLVREPARPYDRRIDVWLDPALGHLPLRLRFTPVPGGEATELRLLGAGPGG